MLKERTHQLGIIADCGELRRHTRLEFLALLERATGIPRALGVAPDPFIGRDLPVDQSRPPEGRPCVGDRGGMSPVLGLPLHGTRQTVLQSRVLLGHPCAPAPDHPRCQNPETPSSGVARLYATPHPQCCRRRHPRQDPAPQGQRPGLSQSCPVPYGHALSLWQAGSRSFGLCTLTVQPLTHTKAGRARMMKPARCPSPAAP